MRKLRPLMLTLPPRSLPNLEGPPRQGWSVLYFSRVLARGASDLTILEKVKRNPCWGGPAPPC
jgi:hypothetical protein